MVRVDLDNQCVWNGSDRVPLTPKAFEVLRFLLSRPGKLATKREILQVVWKDTAVTDGVLSVAIRQLREALGDDAKESQFIQTVHRRGFCWIGPDDVTANASSAADTASVAPPFIGRDDALAALDKAFDDALAGTPQFVFLAGDAGIGKSALADEFARRATARAPQCLVARGQCIETFGLTEAYLPVLDALSSLSQSLGDTEFAAVLRQWAPQWLVQMPALCQPSDRTRLANSIASRDRMLREIVDLFSALIARRPVLLLIDDLHWSDPSTLAFLDLAATRRLTGPLMALATYRPIDARLTNPAADNLVQRLAQQRWSREITLLPLDRPHCDALVRAQLEEPADDRLLETVFIHSAGHPLFALDTLAHLRDTGRATLRNGMWSLTGSYSSADYSTNLHQLIDQQFAHLDQDSLRVLIGAGLFGLDFTAAGAAAASEIDPQLAETVLGTLAQRGVLVSFIEARTLPDGSNTGCYRFSHTLHRKVLEKRPTATERAAGHQRCGDWLRRQGASAAELAHHYDRARTLGCAPLALRYRIEAAHRARELCAWEEATKHYDFAIDLAKAGTDGLSVQALLVERGDALQRSGQLTQADDSLWKAATHAQAAGDGPSLARAALLIGHGFQRLGQSAETLERLCHDALEAIGPSPSPERARLLALLAFLLCSRPGTEAQRASLGAEALAAMRAVGDPATSAWVLTYLRWSAWQPVDRATLTAELAESQSLVEQIADADTRFLMLALIATDALEVGDVAAFDTAVRQWTHLQHEAPLPWAHWFARRIETARALHEGRFDDALRLANDTLELGRRMDNPNVVPLYGAQMACLHLLTGDIDAAAGITEMAAGTPPGPSAWTCMLAYFRCQQDRLDEARSLVHMLARDQFQSIPRDTTWLIGGAGLALACHRLGESQAAAALYDLLSPHRDRSPGLGSSIFGMGHMSRYLALLADAVGNPDLARDHFEQALVEHRRLHAEPWLAFTEADYAAFLTRTSGAAAQDRIDAIRRDARNRAMRLGMKRLAADLTIE